MSSETLGDCLKRLKLGDTLDITQWSHGMSTSYPTKVAKQLNIKIRTRCVNGRFFAKLKDDTSVWDMWNEKEKT